MILRISFLSFFFFLNIQINSYKIKPISDQYLPCQHEIGIMYPYIVYSLCGAENKYVFQKVKAYTNNSDWHMESLEDTYLI